MILQNRVIHQYLKLYNNPTMKVTSEDTGIQLTRVFRLRNGSQMKLYEYEIFKNLINRKLYTGDSLVELAQKCELMFSQCGIKDLEQTIKRKLRLCDLVHK